MPRKLHWALTLAASLLGLSSATSAQFMAAPADRSPENATATEHLTGVVLNSVTSQPVSGVLVTAPGRPLAVLTDYQGRFQFDLTRVAQNAGGVASQQTMPIAFQLRKPGYLTRACLTSVPYYASTQTPSTIELRIIPAAVISGHIYAEAGLLPATSAVMLFRRQVTEGRSSWIQAQGAQINSRGEFRIANLQPGNYKVGAVGYNAMDRRPAASPSMEGVLPAYYPNADNLDTAAPIHLNPGDSPTINLTLHSTVLYRAVVPVVVPEPVNGGPNSPGGVRSVIDRPNRAGNGIRATILPDTPGVELSYDRQSNAMVGYLPSGSYDVHLAMNGPAEASGSVRLTVGGGPVRSAPVTLHPAAEVPVYFRWNSTAGKVLDTEPKSQFANLIPLEPGGSAVPDPPGALQRAPGAGHVMAVSEGVYQLQTALNNGYVASAVSGTTDLLRDPLRVGPGESPQPIEITLRDDGATLRITVAEQSVAALAAPSALRAEQIVIILCIPLDQPMRQPVVQFAVMSTLSAAGSTLTNLAPGHYLVLAAQQDEMTTFTPEYRNPELLAQLMSKGVTVNLSAAEKAAIQVPLLPVEAE